jgi:5-hydroxyisourate hydrolase
MSLSTHVLDTVEGRPAVGVGVRLDSADGEVWVQVGAGCTDGDGRLRWPTGVPGAGDHRLVFATGEWFAAAGVETFYPHVCVEFTIRDPGEHHHVPLLLAPFGYSTYRGT